MLENRRLYERIIRKALMILGIFSFITYCIVQDAIYVYSTLFGGILSILGFLSIVYFTHHVSLKGNVQGRFVSAYLVRYLLYFVAMFIAMKKGLNILSMLVGFLCINVSIKLDTLLQRKEEN